MTTELRIEIEARIAEMEPRQEALWEKYKALEAQDCPHCGQPLKQTPEIGVLRNQWSELYNNIKTLKHLLTSEKTVQAETVLQPEDLRE